MINDYYNIQDIYDNGGQCPEELDSYTCEECSLVKMERLIYEYTNEEFPEEEVYYCPNNAHAKNRCEKLLPILKTKIREEKLKRILNG